MIFMSLFWIPGVGGRCSGEKSKLALISNMKSVHVFCYSMQDCKFEEEKSSHVFCVLLQVRSYHFFSRELVNICSVKYYCDGADPQILCNKCSMCLILFVANCNKSNKSSLAGQSILMYYVTKGTKNTSKHNQKEFIFGTCRATKCFLRIFVIDGGMNIYWSEFLTLSQKRYSRNQPKTLILVTTWKTGLQKV